MLKMTSLLALFLLIGSITYGQRQKSIKNSEVKGIYLTLEGFKSNTFSCTLDKLQKDIKIKLNQFFVSPEISCVSPVKETVFYKDSIFAMQLTNGENFRFINRMPCLIADTSFLYIYTYKTIKIEYKQYGPTRWAKELPVTYYYFSSGEHKEVHPLSVDNLCKFLTVDPDIKIAIKQKFIDDETLHSINQQTKHFVLNDFLIDSEKKK